MKSYGFFMGDNSVTAVMKGTAIVIIERAGLTN